MVPIKSYDPEKICPIFEKGRYVPSALSDLNEKDTIGVSIL